MINLFFPRRALSIYIDRFFAASCTLFLSSMATILPFAILCCAKSLNFFCLFFGGDFFVLFFWSFYLRLPRFNPYLCVCCSSRFYAKKIATYALKIKIQKRTGRNRHCVDKKNFVMCQPNGKINHSTYIHTSFVCDRWANEIWPNMHTGYVTLDWVEKQQSCVQANFSVLCGTSLFCRLLWLRTYILVKIYYFERQKWYVLNGLLKRTCGETKDWKWKAMAEKIESVRFASAWKYAWIFYRFFGSVLNGEFVLSLKKKTTFKE